MGPPSLARRLARRAISIRSRTLPAAVREKARLCLLDWAGCAIAGARHLDLSFLADRRPSEASLVGTGRMASALSAALVNGTAAHLLELDDIHEPSIYHPGAPVIAAALAAAQREVAPGRALLEGVVAGYEVSIALGAALQPDHYRFWHTTGTMGTLGAAAAAGRILGLEDAEMERALHVAATQASGLWATIGGGTPAKALHAGKAAHAGLLSALWVKEGLGSSPTLDVPRGYLEATAGRVGPRPTTHPLTAPNSRVPRRNGVEFGAVSHTETRGSWAEKVDLKRFHILDVGFKRHASCRFTHAAVDAALTLRERVPEPKAVRVRVARSALQLVGRDPVSPEAARFSLAWCVAVAFVRGRVSPEEFTPRALGDSAIRGMVRRVRTVPDNGLERLYPRRWPAIVEVEGARPGSPSVPLAALLRNAATPTQPRSRSATRASEPPDPPRFRFGTRGSGGEPGAEKGAMRRVRVDFARGDPRNPLSHAELVAKFVHLSKRPRFAPTILKLDSTKDVTRFRL